MRIYYDELAKNIVLGQANRLFATGSLEASEFRGRVSIVYKDTNFRELFIAHNRILKEDGSPAGATLIEVLDYLNAEFVKTPFAEVTTYKYVAQLSGLFVTIPKSVHMIDHPIVVVLSPLGNEVSISVSLDASSNVSLRSLVNLDGHKAILT